MRSLALRAAATAALASASPCLAAAQPLAGVPITPDPSGDIRSAFTAAPPNGDLDVVGLQAVFTGSTFRLFSRSTGNIGTTAGALFVWGFNRGQGTARFGAIASNVLFDAVAIVNPTAGTITVNDLINRTSSVVPVGSVSFLGTDLTAVFASSLLPTLAGGFAPSAYTVNLWPRVGTGNNNAQISDFAPDNSNVTVAATVPEPATALLLVPALGAVATVARRRRHTA